MNIMRLFILPGYYFRKTRIPKIPQKISWYLIYFSPILFFFLEIFEKSLDWIIPCLILIIATNYTYENGYIENDLITTKKEKEPSIRLSEEEIKWGRDNIKIIFIMRGIFLSILLYIILKETKINNTIAFSCIIAIQIIYLIYNRCRSMINLILIIPLSFLRFFTPLISLEIFELSTSIIISLLAIYPLCKTIEFSKRKRFKLKKISAFIGNVDFFRVKYYSICCILFLIVPSKHYLFPLYTTIYYLIYRTAILIFSKNKIISNYSNKEYR